MQLTHGDLDADAGQEPDEHAARQEVRDESELQDSRRHEHDGHHQGGQAGHRDPLAGGGREPEAGQAGVQHHGRRGVGPDDEMT